MKFAIMGEPNEYPVANAPQTAGGGTTAFTALGGSNTGGRAARHPRRSRHAAAPQWQCPRPEATLHSPPPAKTGPRRVKSRVRSSNAHYPDQTRPRHPPFSGTWRLQSRERPDSLNEKKPAENAKAAADKTKIWIAAGAAAATLLLALAGFAVFSSASRKEPDPAPSQRATASQGQTPAAGATQPPNAVGLLTPAVAATASAEIAALSGTPKQTASATTSPNAGQPNGAMPVAPTDEPITAKADHATPHKNSPQFQGAPFASAKARRPLCVEHVRRRSPAEEGQTPRLSRRENTCQSLAPIATRSSFPAECTASLARAPIIKAVPGNTRSPSARSKSKDRRGAPMVSSGSTEMEFEPRLAAARPAIGENLEGQGRDFHALG